MKIPLFFNQLLLCIKIELNETTCNNRYDKESCIDKE